MRAWMIRLSLLLIFCAFQLPFTSAQTRKVIEQPAGVNYLLFEAEDYSELFSLTGEFAQDSRWEAFSMEGAESGIMSVGTITGGPNNFNGLSADKSKYDIRVVEPTDAGTEEVYRLYLKVSWTGNGQGSLFVQDAIDEPIGVTAGVGNNEQYVWIDTGQNYNLSPGDYNLILFPREDGLKVDEILLYKYAQLTQSPPLPAEIGTTLIIDQPAAVQTENIDALIGYALPENGQAIGSLLLDITATQNSGDGSVEEISAFSPSREGDMMTVRGYYPFTGSFYYEIKTGPGGEQKLIFQPLSLRCYSFLGDGDISINGSFRWYSPDADILNSSDNLKGTINFLNVDGDIVESFDIPASGALDLSQGVTYNLESRTVSPTFGSMMITDVLLEITFNAPDGSSVWIDDVFLTISGEEETDVLVPVADFGNNNPDDEKTVSPIIFGNTSSNEILPETQNDTVSYFWEYGDGISDFTDLTEPSHEYFETGTYTVCLTVTNCRNCRNMDPSDDCKISDTYCQDIVITEASLPVELTSFTAGAEGRDVRLDWATATEVNNDYFQVEHSRDGAVFSPLARVSGAGDSKAPLTYRYLHERAPAGINYYRLKQVDFDGSFEYSKVVTALIEADAGTLLLYPNPARQEVQVQSDLKDPLRFTLYDSFGRLLRQGTVAPQGAIDLAGLPGGTYHLRLENEDGEILARERVLRIE